MCNNNMVSIGSHYPKEWDILRIIVNVISLIKLLLDTLMIYLISNLSLKYSL